jgi:hypothetical protein
MIPSEDRSLSKLKQHLIHQSLCLLTRKKKLIYGSAILHSILALLGLESGGSTIPRYYSMEH